MQNNAETDLKPGDPDIRAYVGPHAQYDFMGLTQLALLYGLGLREGHKVLDLGCGSLRAGRLLIPFLSRGCYFGIEPNRWLVDEGLQENVGADMLKMKAPRFSFNSDFDCTVFGEKFDFIVAQSILSHTQTDLAQQCVEKVKLVMNDDSIFALTFYAPEALSKNSNPRGMDWVYPGIVPMTRDKIADIFEQAGLSHWPLPWFHPKQSWFAASKNPARLNATDVAGLSGYVVNAEALRRR